MIHFTIKLYPKGVDKASDTGGMDNTGEYLLPVIDRNYFIDIIHTTE